MTDTHGTHQRASVRQTVERQTEALRAENRALLASTGPQTPDTSLGRSRAPGAPGCTAPWPCCSGRGCLRYVERRRDAVHAAVRLFAGDASSQLGALVDDQLRLTIRRQFVFLLLGVVIFTAGLTLLWADLI